MNETLTRSWSPALAALIFPLGLAFTGCGPEPPPSPSAPQPVVNRALGLKLNDLPEGFVLASNEGEEIVIQRRAGLPPGTMVITARPELERGGVNLVKALNERADEVAAMGGKLRQVELGSQLGPAYLARSRWPEGGENGGEREQMQIFALHPTANRMLVITYDYPLSGDTEDRRQDMMNALGLIAALDENSGSKPGGEGQEASAASQASGASAEGSGKDSDKETP
jgi:hypothetical protein